MDMTGEQRIPAPRDEVWAALNDADVLRACIPGCQELIKRSDTEMTALTILKVGPISAKFTGAVTLSDIDPPNGYRITGEGRKAAPVMRAAAPSCACARTAMRRS
ncbi:MAG TPA: carbon monoxide dehydrogenase subunit G [Stellaceae bacterium]